MTDPTDEPRDDADLGALAALLADPDLWADVDPAVEERVLAAVADEASGTDGAPGVAAPERSLPGRRRTAVLAAAAAVVVLAGLGAALAVGTGDDGDEPVGVELALAGTEAAPGAEAVATVTDTPPGTRIDLEVSGLGPAPEGAYYEAWMWDEAGTGVSAGTFHVRGGDATIELWAGVGLDDYPQMSVTLQQEGQVESSGVTLLRIRPGGG